MKPNLITIVLLATLLFSGCTDQRAQQRLDTTDENIKRLFDNDKKAFEAMDEISGRMKVYIDYQTFVAKQSSKKPLDLRNKSFATFDTGSGLLFMAIEDIKPDKDGFILKAKVGNPTSITYSGLDITASWNPGTPADMPTGEGVTAEQLQKWLDKIKEQWQGMPSSKTEVTELIAPGVWTPVDISLRPVKFSELDAVYFDVAIKSVMLPDKK